MKAFYRIKPDDVFAQPSGDISVCIDWQEKSVECPIGTISGFECQRVDVFRGDLSTDKVIELFVRDKYTQSEEFALINAYQSSVAGIDENPEKEAEYLAFLTWRKNMKEVVKEIVPAYIAKNPIVEQAQVELPINEN